MPTRQSRSATPWLAALAASALLASPVSAQDGRPGETAKPKPAVEKSADSDVAHYCANVAPSIVEARIAWQTKRLAELDAQVRQRIADLEKAEGAAHDWIAKREALMAAANDDLVAIYARMQPENAARQIGAMDDRMAAAILGKLKPSAAGAILDEMATERATRLTSLVAGREEKKS